MPFAALRNAPLLCNMHTRSSLPLTQAWTLFVQAEAKLLKKKNTRGKGMKRSKVGGGRGGRARTTTTTCTQQPGHLPQAPQDVLCSELQNVPCCQCCGPGPRSICPFLCASLSPALPPSLPPSLPPRHYRIQIKSHRIFKFTPKVPWSCVPSQCHGTLTSTNSAFSHASRGLCLNKNPLLFERKEPRF